jgi:hypothetical protein
MTAHPPSPTRRSVLAAAGATGAASLLPIHSAAAGSPRSRQLSSEGDLQMGMTKGDGAWKENGRIAGRRGSVHPDRDEQCRQ